MYLLLHLLLCFVSKQYTNFSSKKLANLGHEQIMQENENVLHRQQDKAETSGVYHLDTEKHLHLVQIILVFVCWSFTQCNHHYFVLPKEETAMEISHQVIIIEKKQLK